MTGYKAGDEVTVHWHGKAAPGVIEKVGRTLVHIRSHGRVTAFRISNQHSTGPRIGIGMRFATPAQEQDAREDREREAYAFLREHGVALAFTRKYTLEQVESLAEVVKGWEADADANH